MKLAPISSKMTPVIAERDLVLVQAGKRRRVRIRIGRPVQDVETVDGRDWRCPIVLSVGGVRRAQRGLGGDSLQALVDALRALEEEVKLLEKPPLARLEWLGERWHGIPRVRLTFPWHKKRSGDAQAHTRAARTARARKRRG